MTSSGRDLHLEPWDLPSLTVRAAAEASITKLIDRVSDGRAHCLWIDGETGVGKTSLVEVLANAAPTRECLVLRSDCPFPEEGDLPWGRILATATPPLRFDLIAASLDPRLLHELSGVVPEFGSWPRNTQAAPRLPAADQTQRRWRALAQLLELLSGRTPVVLVIDDIDRAGKEVIGQIAFLFRTLASASILWIITAHPVDPDRSVHPLRRTIERLRRIEMIHLGAFDQEQTRAYLADWIIPDDQDRLAAWLFVKTGGSPLFASELLRSLVEDGLIIPAEQQGRYMIDGNLDAVPIPASLEAFIRERLRGLSPEARGVLRSLAALGGEATAAMLRRVASCRAPQATSALGELSEAGLILKGVAGKDLFRLAQIGLGEVALESFSDPPAERIFVKAAEVLASASVFPKSIRLSRVARALEQAGEPFWDEAAAAYAESAACSWEKHFQGAARAQIETALTILDRSAPALRSPEQERIYRKLEETITELGGKIHTGIGPFRRGVEELERLRDCLSLRCSTPGPGRWISLEMNLGLAHRNLGEYEKALSCYERALKRARGAKWERQRTEIHLEIAWVQYERGNHDEALRSARRSGSIARRIGAGLDDCRARNLEGLITWAQSRPEKAERIFRDTLKRLESFGTIPLVAAAWNNLGLVHWNLGNLDVASRCLTRARRIRIEMGQLLGEAVTIANLALVEEDRGNFEASVRLHRQALRIRESLEDRRGVVIGLGNVANILRQMGECEEAADLIQRALSECRAIGVKSLEPGLLCTRSGIDRLLGDPKRALEAADQAIEIAKRFNNRRLIAYSLDNSARASALLGPMSRARAKMQNAKEEIKSGSPIDLAMILLSEAEMLTEKVGDRRGRSQVKLLEAAKESASEAITLLQKHDAVGRIERVADLCKRLDLLPVSLQQRARVKADAATISESSAQIFCFGPLRIVTDERIKIGPGDWGSHKARAIFALLLFHRPTGAGLHRERVLEAIWPEAPLDTVEHTFHATLALLRKALAAQGNRADWASVVHSGGCYRLVFAEEPWIDCIEFEKSLREGIDRQRHGNYFRAVERYRRAESLYKADFLEDSYQSWTDPIRDRYRQDYSDLLLRLGELALEMWSPADTLEWIGKLHLLDPLDERACRLEMRAHLACGHRKRAIDRYRRLVRELKQEIGAEPEPATRELYRHLIKGDM